MEIKLNGKVYSIEEGASIASFLACEQLPTQGIAIAIDNMVVPKVRWNEYVLEHGTEITMIHAVSGG